jgi:cytochrome o ubiquinol oxidase subunit IV
MAHAHSSKPESGQKTLSAYIVGFVLCVVLTLMAFGLIETRLLSDTYLYITLAALAIVQLFVQSICFLRLNCSAEGKWNLLPFLFTLLIIAILVSGTLWIMYNLNINMAM